jgi:hypothetical protein
MESAIDLELLSSFDAKPIKPALLRALSSVGLEASVGFTERADMNRFMVAPGPDTEHISGTIVLVRVEDWLRDGLLSGQSAAVWAREELKVKVKEFASELAILAHRGKPVWFLCCPSTGGVAEHYKLGALCRTYTNLLSARVGNVSQINVLNWPAVLSANFEDCALDDTNNIPFTQKAFETLAEVVGSEVGRLLAQQSGSRPATSGASPELAAYLAGLQVRIELTMAKAADRHHVDHIIRSSASFSLTGEQPHIAESEVDAVIAKDRCVVISVSDRVADHGPSGVVVYRQSENALVVDWMSLSCPVLGKQVEYALVLALARTAKERGCSRVIFEYRPSARNQPIHVFLQSVAERESGSRFVLAVDEADARISAGAVNGGAWSLNAAGLEKAAGSGS